ncbi:MAG: enoyl-CoA hydratase/isomerase family protein [Thermodesulfobacteriota bacterium]
MKIEAQSELFTAGTEGPVAVIRLERNMIRQLVRIEVKKPLFDFLDHAQESGDIRAVLIMGCPEKLSKQELTEFFGSFFQPDRNVTDLARIHNAVGQLIAKIHAMTKFTVHADCGEINSIFFNVSLACDWRIVSDRTVFCYPTLDLGIIPMGAGIFFMGRKLGSSATMRILLSGKDIPAAEALSLGLVDQVTEAENLDAEALACVQRFAEKPLRLVADVKRLLSFGGNDLKSFLDMENRLVMESVQSERFRRRLQKHMDR